MAGGRKLEFDKQAALEAAMHVFWQKGYIGASLSDLTQSMGINKPSIYSAFGNKEELFLLAAEHYIDSNAKQHAMHLSAPEVGLKQRLKNYLMSVVAGQCQHTTSKGCLISLCVTEAASGGMPEKALRLLNSARSYMPKLLENLLTDDEEAQQLGLDKAAASHALFLATMVHGTSAMARAERDLQELETVVDHALVAIGL